MIERLSVFFIRLDYLLRVKRKLVSSLRREVYEEALLKCQNRYRYDINISIIDKSIKLRRKEAIQNNQKDISMYESKRCDIV